MALLIWKWNKPESSVFIRKSLDPGFRRDDDRLLGCREFSILAAHLLKHRHAARL